MTLRENPAATPRNQDVRDEELAELQAVCEQHARLGGPMAALAKDIAGISGRLQTLSQKLQQILAA